MKFRFLLQNQSIAKLNNIFSRNYFRSTIIPRGIIQHAQHLYLNELKPNIACGNLNPSLNEITEFQLKINQYLKENWKKNEIKNFYKLVTDFANTNSSNSKNNLFTVLELIGLDQPTNQSLTQDIFFKILTISAIMEMFGIKRISHDDSPAIGFLNNNNRFLPSHCDRINDEQIPEFVAIVTIQSNSNAFTFFTENQIIYRNFQSQYPQSFKILQEVYFCKNQLNEKGFFLKNKAHKIINYNDDGSIFLNYSFSNNPYLISDTKECKYSQREVDKAIGDFSTICLNLSESFKFVCDQKNNVLFFKNQKVLHGRSEVMNHEERKMIYLPYESKIEKFNKTKIITPNPLINNPKSSAFSRVRKFNSKG